MEDMVRIESAGDTRTVRKWEFCARCRANSFCDMRELRVFSTTENLMTCECLRGGWHQEYIPRAVVSAGVLSPERDVEFRLLGKFHGALLFPEDGAPEVLIELWIAYEVEVRHTIDDPELVLLVVHEVGRLVSDVMRGVVLEWGLVVIPVGA